MRLKITFEQQVLLRFCTELGGGLVSAETIEKDIHDASINAQESGQVSCGKTILKGAFSNIEMNTQGSRPVVSADVNQKFLTSCSQKRDAFPACLQNILLGQAEELSSNGHPLADGAIMVQPA